MFTGFLLQRVKHVAEKPVTVVFKKVLVWHVGYSSLSVWGMFRVGCHRLWRSDNPDRAEYVCVKVCVCIGGVFK